MNYTIKQLADLSGVSVRALHYYDEIDLLNPGRVSNNGYRSYEQADLLTLQQILFYKRLGLSLEEIKSILHDADFDIVHSLEYHRLQVKKDIVRLNKLLNTINKTIDTMKGTLKIKDKEYFENLTEEEIEKHKAEARKEYGNYQDRTKGLSKEQFKKLLEEGHEITAVIINLMNEGKKPEDVDVQKNIELHYLYMNKFWDCNYEAYMQLGTMYVDDTRFKTNLDSYREGLAEFMRDAMKLFSTLKLK